MKSSSSCLKRQILLLEVGTRTFSAHFHRLTHLHYLLYLPGKSSSFRYYLPVWSLKYQLLLPAYDLEQIIAPICIRLQITAGNSNSHDAVNCLLELGKVPGQIATHGYTGWYRRTDIRRVLEHRGKIRRKQETNTFLHLSCIELGGE